MARPGDAVLRFLTRPWTGDLLLVSALVLLSLAVFAAPRDYDFGITIGIAPPRAASLRSVPLILCAALPLLWRRAAPIPVLAAVTCTLLAQKALGEPSFASDLSLLVALYSAGAHAPWRTAAIAVAAVAVPLTAFVHQAPGESPETAGTFLAFVIVLPALLGAFQRLRRDALAGAAPAAAGPGPRAGADAAGLALLTEREREVLELLAHGRSNAEIAAVLHLSRETVKTYVARILRKLGLPNRTAAAVYAHQHGVAPDA